MPIHCSKVEDLYDEIVGGCPELKTFRIRLYLRTFSGDNGKCSSAFIEFFDFESFEFFSSSSPSNQSNHANHANETFPAKWRLSIAWCQDMKNIVKCEGLKISDACIDIPASSPITGKKRNSELEHQSQSWGQTSTDWGSSANVWGQTSTDWGSSANGWGGSWYS